MIILSLFTRGHTVGGEPEPIDHRLEPRFGMENVPTGWSPRNAYTRAKCFFLLSSVIVYSRAYGGRGDRAHRPPFRTEVRHGQRPTGMMSAECLYASNECAAQPVGGGAEPIDHRPERSSARKTSPRVRKTAGCRQRSLRRTINHRLHPLLWLALKTGGRGARAHRPPSRTEVRHGIVFPVDALAIFA